MAAGDKKFHQTFKRMVVDPAYERTLKREKQKRKLGKKKKA